MSHRDSTDREEELWTLANEQFGLLDLGDAEPSV
jgi:hypothetical protein